MAWSNWEVLLYLKGLDTPSMVCIAHEPRSLGIVKARTHAEAENKGCAIARKRGLPGAIDVIQQ